MRVEMMGCSIPQATSYRREPITLLIARSHDPLIPANNVIRTRSAVAAEFRAKQDPMIARALALFNDGHVGRAARTLANSTGIGNLADPTIRHEMELKHPRQAIDEETQHILATANNFAIAPLDPQKLLKVVKKLNTGSAPGYDGLTPQIMMCTLRDHENALLHCKLITDVANGRMIEPIATLVQRGKLFALVKESATATSPATHRPVAISSFLYRVAGKIVKDSIQKEVADYLAPTQLGITVPAACETTVHNIRQRLLTDNSIAALQVDIKNAFNTIDRSAMIKQVMTLPCLEKAQGFVRMAYGTPTPILIPDQQGDLEENETVRGGSNENVE